MPLINQLKEVCDALSEKGWREYLRALTGNQMDISQGSPEDLLTELTKPLERNNLNLNLAGFEDFARDGLRGITPGKPAQSILYHALASPNVVIDGFDPDQYPTLTEIETVENVVYASANRSFRDLRKFVEEATGDQQNLCVCIFAYEYRPSVDTPHRKHADTCYSRAGVSRVGNTEPFYNKKLRGFEPTVADDKFGMRVQPSRFGAFIAMKVRGDQEKFIPMNFKTNTPADFPAKTNPNDTDDSRRSFWIPIHKLFPGPECIQGMELNFAFRHYHENAKLRRIHLALGAAGFDSGWHEPDLSKAPFIIDSGLIELAPGAGYPAGTLMPVPHNLVEAATYQGAPLYFNVPVELALAGVNNLGFIDGTTLVMPTDRTPERIIVKSAPEYVHIRRRLNDDGTELDLNTRADIVREMKSGNYQARHYLDFTGDGWVTIVMPDALAIEITAKPLSAYSILAAPDFFPCVDQREIMEWSIDTGINPWFVPPSPLSSTRVLPNVQLKDSDFDQEDDTLTSIISAYYDSFPANARIRGLADGLRNSCLPDACAGFFAPGWEASVDVSRQTGKIHLAAYGLGSPFPEDAKLCAAINAFWPAVAPDVARTIQNYDEPGRLFFSVAPLTNDELGWDGTLKPQLANREGRNFIEYQANEYTDWTMQALNNKFEIQQLCKIDTSEYKRRVYAMYIGYRSLGIINNGQKILHKLLNFDIIDTGHADVTEAANQTGQRLSGNRLYRLEIYRVRANGNRALLEPSGKLNTVLVEVTNRSVVIAGSTDLYTFTDGRGWQYHLAADFA